MTPEQAYLKYIIKVEKNSTNDNISTDRGRFAYIFNEAQNKFIEWLLDNKGTDDIRYIEDILVSDYPIKAENKKEHSLADLPKNYFDLSNVYAIGSDDCCKDEKIYLFPIKEENKNEILQDEHNRPSFKYRESPYIIGQNKIKVYKEPTTTIDKLYLSYYRVPTQIELQNADNPESKFKDTKLDFSDRTLDRIISLAAGEFDLNQENQRFQLQKQRAVQKP